MALKDNYNHTYYTTVYSRFLNTSDYSLSLSRFWMYNIFLVNGYNLDKKKVLDFGSGPGHLTSSINAECYDISDYAQDLLEKNNRQYYKSLDEVPVNHYDYILSSHSLEHAINPVYELSQIRNMLKVDGKFFLILPQEVVPGPKSLKQDIHKHFYVWNFQTIANLLIESGFKLLNQDVIYGPMGLKKLFNLALVRKLGRLKKHFPSLFIISEKVD